MKYIEKITDVLTGETTIIERDYTSEELIEIEKIQSEHAKLQAEIEAKAAARQVILDRLGLTEEEARLLLGGN